MLIKVWNYTDSKPIKLVPTRLLECVLDDYISGEPMTLRTTIESYQRIQEAEFEYPIVLREAHLRETAIEFSSEESENCPIEGVFRYVLVDGEHRIAKAFLEKQRTIPTVAMTYSEWNAIL